MEIGNKSEDTSGKRASLSDVTEHAAGIKQENLEGDIYKPVTIGELARQYDRDKKTVLRWIESIQHLLGPRQGHRYDRRQVAIIYRFLGLPVLLFGFFVSGCKAIGRSFSKSDQVRSAIHPEIIDAGDHGIGAFHPSMLLITGLVTLFKLRSITQPSAYYGGVHKSTDIYRAKLMLQIISIIMATFLSGYFLGKMIF